MFVCTLLCTLRSVFIKLCSVMQNLRCRSLLYYIAYVTCTVEKEYSSTPQICIVECSYSIYQNSRQHLKSAFRFLHEAHEYLVHGTEGTFRFFNTFHAILVTERIYRNSCSEYGRQFKINWITNAFNNYCYIFFFDKRRFIFFEQHNLILGKEK